MMRDIFPDVELLSSAPPDEVIAVGAALEAGLLTGRDGITPEEESVAVDVSATDLLVKVYLPFGNIQCIILNSKNVNCMVMFGCCRRWMNLELRFSLFSFHLVRHCLPADITSSVERGKRLASVWRYTRDLSASLQRSCLRYKAQTPEQLANYYWLLFAE